MFLIALALVGSIASLIMSTFVLRFAAQSAGESLNRNDTFISPVNQAWHDQISQNESDIHAQILSPASIEDASRACNDAMEILQQMNHNLQFQLQLMYDARGEPEEAKDLVEEFLEMAGHELKIIQSMLKAQDRAATEKRSNQINSRFRDIFVDADILTKKLHEQLTMIYRHPSETPNLLMLLENVTPQLKALKDLVRKTSVGEALRDARATR